MNEQLQKAIVEYLDASIELERAEYRSDVEPFEAHAERLRLQLSDRICQLQKGYQCLVDEIQKLHPGKELPRANFQKRAFDLQAITDFYEAASHILDTHRFQEGRDAFFFLVQIAPEMPEFWLDLGFSYLQLGDYNEAIDSFKRALELKAHMADAYLLTARAYMSMKDFEQAQKTCDMGIQYATQHKDKDLGTMLEEAKGQIDRYFTESKYGTFTS